MIFFAPEPWTAFTLEASLLRLPLTEGVYLYIADTVLDHLVGDRRAFSHCRE